MHNAKLNESLRELEANRKDGHKAYQIEYRKTNANHKQKAQ